MDLAYGIRLDAVGPPIVRSAVCCKVLEIQYVVGATWPPIVLELINLTHCPYPGAPARTSATLDGKCLPGAGPEDSLITNSGSIAISG